MFLIEKVFCMPKVLQAKLSHFFIYVSLIMRPSAWSSEACTPQRAAPVPASEISRSMELPERRPPPICCSTFASAAARLGAALSVVPHASRTLIPATVLCLRFVFRAHAFEIDTTSAQKSASNDSCSLRIVRSVWGLSPGSFPLADARSAYGLPSDVLGLEIESNPFFVPSAAAASATATPSETETPSAIATPSDTEAPSAIETACPAPASGTSSATSDTSAAADVGAAAIAESGRDWGSACSSPQERGRRHVELHSLSHDRAAAFLLARKKCEDILLGVSESSQSLRVYTVGGFPCACAPKHDSSESGGDVDDDSLESQPQEGAGPSAPLQPLQPLPSPSPSPSQTLSAQAVSAAYHVYNSAQRVDSDLCAALRARSQSQTPDVARCTSASASASACEDSSTSEPSALRLRQLPPVFATAVYCNVQDRCWFRSASSTYVGELLSCRSEQRGVGKNNIEFVVTCVWAKRSSGQYTVEDTRCAAQWFLGLPPVTVVEGLACAAFQPVRVEIVRTCSTVANELLLEHAT